jgi:hypothetical protein
MFLRTCEEAEAVVARESSLEWDGWDILLIRKTPGALFNKDGIFINGAWHTHRRITPDERGWKLPKRFSR